MKALKQIVEAQRKGELLIASISFWEVAMLVQKGRLILLMTSLQWRIELLQKGLVEIPMTGGIAIVAGELDGLHGDPADRMIVSTAISLGARLCTADGKLLAWQGAVSLLNARN